MDGSAIFETPFQRVASLGRSEGYTRHYSLFASSDHSSGIRKVTILELPILGDKKIQAVLAVTQKPHSSDPVLSGSVMA
jgi:hypothetical protein